MHGNALLVLAFLLFWDLVFAYNTLAMIPHSCLPSDRAHIVLKHRKSVRLVARTDKRFPKNEINADQKTLWAFIWLTKVVQTPKGSQGGGATYTAPHEAALSGPTFATIVVS